MLGYIFFVLIIAVVIYAYIDQDGHFAATASAIKQIWSGNCRLACRNTKPMPPRTSMIQSDEGGTSSQVNTGYPGYQDNCICASCPCALVDNVLQTCSPVTGLYCSIVEAIFLAFYDFIKACTDLYERVYSRLQISKQRAEGRKTSQIGTLPQVTNFMFNDTLKLAIKKGDERDPNPEAGTSNDQKNDEVKPRVEKTENYPDTSCPSCIEKGVTCIGRCPAERTKKE